MLRCTPSCFKLRRKRTPYVQKFLEGCPLPSTLVDDLAGANLKSSTPFFSTSPRYIVPAEKRLSKLYFHHALYPAGGARRPYRVVIVRNGRGVRNHFGVAIDTSAAAAVSAAGSGGSLSPGTSARNSHPVWRDPARRPFFYSSPSGLSSSGNHNSGSNSNSNNNDVSSIVRPGEDTLLAPLCGIVENHFASILKEERCRVEVGNEETACPVRRGAVIAELTELLSAGHGGVVVGDEGKGLEGRKVKDSGLCESSALLERLLQATASFPFSFFYVQTQLPPSAVFMQAIAESTTAAAQSQFPLREPNENKEGTKMSLVAQLAGGLVPTVPFAVGLPLLVRSKVKKSDPGQGKIDTGAIMPFGHIQCLLRVRTRGKQCTTGVGMSSVVESAVREESSLIRQSDTKCALTHSSGNILGSGSRSLSTAGAIVEPWKLGVSLDPKVPFHVRTITEKRATGFPRTNSGDEAASLLQRFDNVLGRSDCETYLLPQRELLLSFHAPEEVVAMCAAQNEERLKRQVALGYSGPTHVFAEGPRTATRLLRDAHCNHATAEAAAARCNYSNFPQGEGQEDLQQNTETRRGRIVYDVRALPGDVVFIPRGWTYTVERIIGTAVLHAASTTNTSTNMPLLGYEPPSQQSAHDTLARQKMRAAFISTRTQYDGGLQDASVGTVTKGAEPIKESSVEGGEEQVLNKAGSEVSAVDVDAFLLCYRPYPVLSAQQAANYVSANYVHSGVEEFYVKVMSTFSTKVEKFGSGKMIRVHTPALQCAFATLGAAINSVKVWDAHRTRWVEVNCAYNSPQEAETDPDYMGPTVGRYGGRIKNGNFTLDGEVYHVSRNMKGGHLLHGGADALHKRHWSFFLLETDDILGVRFKIVSPHMDQGFPAELQCHVFYYVERKRPNVLHTKFSGFIPEGSPADATVVNLFNHAYWNLNGVPGTNTPENPHWKQPKKVYNIVLKMPCSHVVDSDPAAIPTGRLNDVTGTCLDFRNGKPLGEDIDNKAVLNRDPCGYDHPYMVDGWDGTKKRKLLLNADAYSPSTRIQMKVYSTFPCIWLCTANHKPADVTGGKGQRYGRHTGVCLEPQYLPDSPNQPTFPSVVLRRGNIWREAMMNEFNIRSDSKV